MTSVADLPCCALHVTFVIPPNTPTFFRDFDSVISTVHSTVHSTTNMYCTKMDFRGKHTSKRVLALVLGAMFDFTVTCRGADGSRLGSTLNHLLGIKRSGLLQWTRAS
jgi:hypothetical protein